MERLFEMGDRILKSIGDPPLVIRTIADFATKVQLRVHEVYLQRPGPVVLGFALLIVTITVFLTGPCNKSADLTSKKEEQSDSANGEDDVARRAVASNVEEVARRALGSADPKKPQLEGAMVPCHGLVLSNMEEPVTFENDFCYGTFAELHVPTYDKELKKSGKYFFGEYFTGKTRIWESRLQMRFKADKELPTTGDIYFGIELENYVPLSRMLKSTQAGIVKLLTSVVGDKVYHSPGDDPKKVKGTIERPVFTMPLYAFDQFIVTPEGEEPPSLTDPDVQYMGSKRSGRVGEYKQELKDLEFQVGPTYTFCFWGISKYLDKLRWEVLLPLPPYRLDFSKLCGGPPVHVVLYTLKPSENGEKETRHLQSLKQYYFDLAFWSSKARPPASRVNSILNLDDGSNENGTPRAAKKAPWWKQSLACCTARG